MLSGPHPEKAEACQSSLKLKACFSDVKQIADKMDPEDLPGVELPLDEISDFPLIHDGSQLTKDSDDPPAGLPLSHLKDHPFVAMELSMSVYKVGDNAGYRLSFTQIYILGNKAIWDKEMGKKGCGPLAAKPQKRSKKFYSEEDKQNWPAVSVSPSFSTRIFFWHLPQGLQNWIWMQREGRKTSGWNGGIDRSG